MYNNNFLVGGVCKLPASYPQVIICPRSAWPHYTARPCSARSFFAGLFSRSAWSHYTARPCSARSFFVGPFPGQKPSRVFDVPHKIRIVASLLCNWTFVQLTQNRYFVQYVFGVFLCGLFLGRFSVVPPTLPPQGGLPRTPTHTKKLFYFYLLFFRVCVRAGHITKNTIYCYPIIGIYTRYCVCFGEKLFFLLRKRSMFRSIDPTLSARLAGVFLLYLII